MAGFSGMNFYIYLKHIKSYINIWTFLYQFTLVSSISMKAEQYTTQSFEHIRTSSYPHFVMFHAPWCGHCKRVQPIWDKFAEESHKTRRMKVAKIDCTEFTPLCAAENIKAYPTFLLYSNNQKYAFRGTRDIPDFTEFVNSKVSDLKDGQVPLEGDTSSQNEVKKEDSGPRLPLLLSKETFNAEVGKDYTFVDFYAPWCSHCNKLEPTWNKLADTLKYNDKVTIAKVDCTADPELCQSHNINGYPTLNLYKDGYLFVSYTQGRTLASLVSFVQAHLAADNELNTEQNTDSEEDGSGETPPPDEETPPPVEETGPSSLTMTLNEETYKGMMDKKPHLIYFHDSGPQFSNMDLLIFEQVQHRMTFLKHDVTVAVIDCTQTNIVCDELGINHYPSIIYFKSVNNYSEYFGMIDVEKIVEWVAKKNEEYRKNESKDEL